MTKNNSYDHKTPCGTTYSFSRIARKLGTGFASQTSEHDETAAMAYDFWWHLGHDTMITSEWGIPSRLENGLDPEHLLSSGYGHQLHVWNLRKRKHEQAIDLGKEHQMVLELRPSHDPTRTFGFAGVVV